MDNKGVLSFDNAVGIAGYDVDWVDLCDDCFKCDFFIFFEFGGIFCWVAVNYFFFFLFGEFWFFFFFFFFHFDCVYLHANLVVIAVFAG